MANWRGYDDGPPNRDRGLRMATPEVRYRVASQGGKATLAKHGEKHFTDLARAGGKALLEKRGSGYFRKLGIAGAKLRWKDKGK